MADIRERSQLFELLKKTFVEEVAPAFRFLIDEYGFSCKTSERWWVIRFRTKDVELTVYCDPRCNELDMAIGLCTDKQQRSYDLYNVLEAMVGKRLGSTFGFPPYTVEQMKSQISELADFVRKHYGPLLTGDHDAFCRLESTELQRGRRGMEQYRQEARERAEKASQSGDYAIAINFYESIGQYLTESEVVKLKELRKHIRPGLIDRIKRFFISQNKK